MSGYIYTRRLIIPLETVGYNVCSCGPPVFSHSLSFFDSSSHANLYSIVLLAHQLTLYPLHSIYVSPLCIGGFISIFSILFQKLNLFLMIEALAAVYTS